MDYKSVVYSRLKVEGIHNWKNCPIEEVSYLKDDHRHIFEIIAYKEVFHIDRDIEFIQFKHEIKDYLLLQYWNEEKRCLYFGSKSCEMIARELIEKFNLCKCEVNEDSENGAILERI